MNMQFVPIAGGVDIATLTKFAAKVGDYVIVVNDLTEAGTRIIHNVAHSFRKIRKLYKAILDTYRATVYCFTGEVVLASQWQGVVWHGNPTFNGQ